MNDYFDLPKILTATEIDWISIGQGDLKSNRRPLTCQNETLRFELRKAIQKSAHTYCSNYSDSNFIRSECDFFIYRVAFKVSKKVLFCHIKANCYYLIKFSTLGKVFIDQL